MNEMLEEKSKNVKEIIHWRILFGSILLVIIGASIFIIYSYLTFPEIGWGELVEKIIVKLVEVLMIAGFIGMAHELLVRRRIEGEMTMAVGKAINADIKFLKEKFRGKAVDSIIKNCFEAKLCNADRAVALYEGLGLPSFNEEIFRSEFDYKINLAQLDSDLEIDHIVFSTANYFRMREDLIYKKRLRIKENQALIVGLCFDERHLEHYRGKECIYRTILRLADNDKENLLERIKINPNEILKIFSIETVKINGEDLDPPTLRSYDDDKGIEMIYYSNKKKEGVTIEISINSIRNKNINYYSAYLYDPTFNPKIRLEYCDEIGEVFPIAFFTSKSKGANKKTRPDPPNPLAKYCSIEINEWVFPTSGVVFVWKNADSERKDR